MDINNINNTYSLNQASQLFAQPKHSSVPKTTEAKASESTVLFEQDSVELSDEAKKMLEKAKQLNQSEETSDTAQAPTVQNEATIKENENTAPKEETGKSKEEKQDEKTTEKLEDRDREVKIHEQTHKSNGGPYAGSIVYEYQTGPDGKRYAVGGHVDFNVAPESTPEETIRKADIIYRAALAPDEPSGADRNLAQKAIELKQEAQAQIQEEKAQRSEPENNEETVIAELDLPSLIQQ